MTTESDSGMHHFHHRPSRIFWLQMIPIWKQISGPRTQGGFHSWKGGCLFRRQRVSDKSPRAKEYTRQSVDLTHHQVTLHVHCVTGHGSKHVCSSRRRNARRSATTLTLHGQSSSVFEAPNAMDALLQANEATAAWLPSTSTGLIFGLSSDQLPTTYHGGSTEGCQLCA